MALQDFLRFEEVTSKHASLLDSWIYSPELKEIYGRGDKKFVVYDKEKPFGYIQSYDVCLNHEYAAYARSEGKTAGIDLLIGDKSFLKKGYGFSMLQQFVSWLGPEVERILVDPRKEVFHFFEKFGFIQLGECKERSILAMNLRKAVRGIILDGDENILLIRMRADPMKGEQKHLTEFWLAPGGKIEEGESDEEALRREIKEETGFEDVHIERFLFVHERLNTRHGFPLRLFNRYYLVRSQETEVHPKGLEEYEKDIVLGYKWWSLDELSATQETVFPPNLVQKIGDCITWRGN